MRRTRYSIALGKKPQAFVNVTVPYDDEIHRDIVNSVIDLYPREIRNEIAKQINPNFDYSELRPHGERIAQARPAMMMIDYQGMELKIAATMFSGSDPQSSPRSRMPEGT